MENVLGRLVENRRREHPQPVLQVILGASLGVRSAVIFPPWPVILAFLPILTLSGVTDPGGGT